MSILSQAGPLRFSMDRGLLGFDGIIRKIFFFPRRHKMQGPCLICGQEAEFLERDGERYLEGRDDVCCSKCGSYSIADEHKPLLKRALGSQSSQTLLSFRVSSRYHSGSSRCVVEIDPASLKEMLNLGPTL